MKQLKAAIAEIQSEIEYQIENINQGGCGWFAYFMVTSLEKLGIKAEVKIINRWSKSTDHKKEILNNYINGNDCSQEDLYETSFIHCYIRVGRFYFDAMSDTLPKLKRAYGEYQFKGSYTTKELKTALEVAGWNDNYDTDNNNLLKNIIEGNLIKLHETV